ncbi:hypothetical protein RJ639_022794, partial [Escallonia herrerae]
MSSGEKSSAAMSEKKKVGSSFGYIFMHADGFDKLLMTFGMIGAVADGLSMPVMLIVTSRLMNNLGEGYCWTRTAERQASRLRERYLKAVLRQDVGYFDLHVTSTAEVITSVSSDSLIIQEVISEKVPVFVMNMSTFIGAYIVAFVMLWKLAIVGFPFVVFLVIPGLMYGRALIGIARKMRDEYNKAGTVVEQAISSVRTVYSFVGENKTIAEYSAALQGTVKLGLKQGLAKGLAIGSNGVVFAIWSFMSFYGSRLVMYHHARGGTVFAVGAAIAIGGLYVIGFRSIQPE